MSGEDRWLCTLLLQQGWRVEYNAAADAYTNAPQDFKEFYNQRRRWGPSTMANTIDLLGSGGLTSQRNSSISKPYILYQVISMAASILGPATICLMISGRVSSLEIFIWIQILKSIICAYWIYYSVSAVWHKEDMFLQLHLSKISLFVLQEALCSSWIWMKI